MAPALLLCYHVNPSGVAGVAPLAIRALHPETRSVIAHFVKVGCIGCSAITNYPYRLVGDGHDVGGGVGGDAA